MDYTRVLILHFTNGMSSREISETTGDGKTTVNEFLKRFRGCEELSYPLTEEVTNEFIVHPQNLTVVGHCVDPPHIVVVHKHATVSYRNP